MSLQYSDIMAHATVIALADKPGAKFAAFLNCAAHLAWRTGDSADQATARLWAEVVQNEPQIRRRMKTLGLLP